MLITEGAHQRKGLLRERDLQEREIIDGGFIEEEG